MRQKKPIIYIDGKYLKADAKTIEAFTPGEFQAEGVFETILAVGNKIFDLRAHLRRLRQGFPQVKVSEHIIENIVMANGFDVTRVRVIVWRDAQGNHVAVMALKYSLPLKKKFKACLIKTNRTANARFANIKSLDYKLFADAYKNAKAKGFDEALLINRKGYIFEASRANIFWIKNDKLYTPPLSSGCLNGITRAKIIAFSRKLNQPFQEKNLTTTELFQADNVFITNSLIGIIEIFFPKSLPRH